MKRSLHASWFLSQKLIRVYLCGEIAFAGSRDVTQMRQTNEAYKIAGRYEDSRRKTLARLRGPPPSLSFCLGGPFKGGALEIEKSARVSLSAGLNKLITVIKYSGSVIKSRSSPPPYKYRPRLTLIRDRSLAQHAPKLSGNNVPYYEVRGDRAGSSPSFSIPTVPLMRRPPANAIISPECSRLKSN